MSHPYSSETLPMEQLRSSPSQQHLNPSRSSSLPSQEDEAEAMDQRRGKSSGSKKIDLYSVPVFLLELILLTGLAYLAYYIHFEYKHEPLVFGFYCDDVSLRQRFVESKFTRLFTRPEQEIVTTALLLVIPIVLIIFCELVNSMFGSLKFRKIRACMQCCKLHSITRRTIRFAGAYALGFFILMISCNFIANTSGQLRPYFAQECPELYRTCSAADLRLPASGPGVTERDTGAGDSASTASLNSDLGAANPDIGAPSSGLPSMGTPPSAPIMGNNLSIPTAAALVSPPSHQLSRQKREISSSNPSNSLVRQWVDLTGVNLKQSCQFIGGDSIQTRKFEQLAMAWPSFQATIVTYATLYVSCYLAFVGTARPFRFISCCLIALLLILATRFNVQLVLEHYNNWQDVVAGAFLALFTLCLVLYVYLNRFRDSHYYENQKLAAGKQVTLETFRGYQNQNDTSSFGNYNLDKANDEPSTMVVGGQNGQHVNAVSNNDLAMRYFQIPRANYRGAPRPLSSLRA